MIRRFFAPSESFSVIGVALLVLRFWLGLTMLLNHGLGKLQTYETLKGGFPDPLGVGSSTSLSLAIGAEFFCALLLILGLFTRFAALALTTTMGVAFLIIHQAALSGENSGELAFVYMAGFMALLIAGPGKFAVDQWFNTMEARRQDEQIDLET